MVGFLYGQTQYSFLENTIFLSDYVKFAKENGFLALSITDSNMHGAYKFYDECKKNNIKPIIGLKIKIESTVGRDNFILAYAKSKEGYKSLVHLENIQAVNGIVKDYEIITNNKDLVFVSASFDSDLDYFMYSQNYDLCSQEVLRLKSYGDNFYYGLMPNTFMFDTIYQDALDLIEKYSLKALPVAKASYLLGDDDAYEALIKIGGINKRGFDDDFHLRSYKEIEEMFEEFPNVFADFEELVNEIDDNIMPINNTLPVFHNKVGISSEEYLKKLCYKGLERRLEIEKISDDIKYKKQLDHELSVINKMGYDDYFLIVHEFISYAKKSGINVGPGRGSAVGSLVSYVLGITDINPLQYDLLFERFLNPERVSMPDIDVDIPDDRREEIIKHVRDLYGNNKVCAITTFQTFQTKSSLNQLFNIYNVNNSYMKDVLKAINNNSSLDEMISEFSSHPDIVKVIKISKKIEGLPHHISTHPAGIILSNNDLGDIVPLRPCSAEMYQTEYETSDLESLGLLKIDFLGLHNLSIVDKVLKRIGKNIDIKHLPLDDSKTFELFQKGKTLGVHQYETPGLAKAVINFKPTCFEDIVALNALYRPGPMKSIPDYIERKKTKKITYLNNDLEDILKDTYGIIVYQEQIMKIAVKFAGYSLGEADVLRRAVSKKKREVLEKERVRFVDKAKEKGYQESISNNIYDYIVEFADYGFNRSHSVAYSFLAYQMAYLKANYPLEFSSVMIDESIGNKDSMILWINYLKGNGIQVLAPSVNHSKLKSAKLDNKLILPLTAVKELGSIAAKEIVLERNNGQYENINDFKLRLKNKVNNQGIEALIHGGAFDEFNICHKQEVEALDNIFGSYVNSSELIEDINEYSDEELQSFEQAYLGFNLKYDIFKEYQKLFTDYKATMPNDLVLNKISNVIGTIEHVRYLKTKNNEDMAFVSLNANGESLDIVIFNDVFIEYGKVLEEKGLILFNGTPRLRNGVMQLQAIKMRKL